MNTAGKFSSKVVRRVAVEILLLKEYEVIESVCRTYDRRPLESMIPAALFTGSSHQRNDKMEWYVT